MNRHNGSNRRALTAQGPPSSFPSQWDGFSPCHVPKGPSLRSPVGDHSHSPAVAPKTGREIQEDSWHHLNQVHRKARQPPSLERAWILQAWSQWREMQKGPEMPDTITSQSLLQLLPSKITLHEGAHTQHDAPCLADGWGCMEPHKVSAFSRESLSQAMAPPGSAPGSSLHLFTCRLCADCRADGGENEELWLESQSLEHLGKEPPRSSVQGAGTPERPTKGRRAEGAQPHPSPESPEDGASSCCPGRSQRPAVHNEFLIVSSNNETSCAELNKAFRRPAGPLPPELRTPSLHPIHIQGSAAASTLIETGGTQLW